MATTIEDLVFIDAKGYHYADYPTFLQWVQDQYRGIYGADIYLGADSLDGQWTAILAQSLFDTAANGANTYNSFSPVSAQGIGLSRVVKINGISRNIPTNSEVVLTIVGTAGTTISNGIATDNVGQQWALPASVTIPPGGDIDVTATAVEEGAINADANTVVNIFTPTLGWQTVNNTAAASPGSAVETDAELRARQAVSTSLPALTVIQATKSALENLPGVTQVKPYENVTDTTDANGLPEHSVCFVVEGGDVTEITDTIGLYKTPGTNTYASGTNARNEIYNDPAGLPVPINFYNPAVPSVIAVEITIHPLTTSWSTSFEIPIAQAIADLIESYGIGGTVLYTQLFAAAYNPPPSGGVTVVPGSYSVVSIQINIDGGSFAGANIVLDFNAIPVCDPDTDVDFTIS